MKRTKKVDAPTHQPTDAATIARLAVRAANSLLGHEPSYSEMVEHSEWDPLAKYFEATDAAYLSKPKEQESAAQEMAYFEIGKAIGARWNQPECICDDAARRLTSVLVLVDHCMDHNSNVDAQDDDGWTIQAISDLVTELRADLRKVAEHNEQMREGRR